MVKRHRNNHADSDSDGSDADENSGFTISEENDADESADDINNTNTRQSKGNNDPSPSTTTSRSSATPKKKKVRKLKLSATEDFNAKLQKRGIVYLARVPPRMGPAKVKTLLSDFGSITRIYLSEEDKTVRKKRKKAGGSGGKRYTEGWIEFESKKVAKLVGETLNMTRVANQKGSIHYDDLWSIKYLKGFKWSHLTEKVAYERRMREQKLRVEMMEVRRENALYMAQVEAGKKLDHIEERRKKRNEKEGGGGGGSSSIIAEEEGRSKTNRKNIRQKKPFEGERSMTAKSAILGSLI